MIGRMGTGADAVFGPDAMASILDAAERSREHGGLRGSTESDPKGEFRVVLGAGDAEVGMYFVSEGTEATGGIVKEFSERFGDGILVVIDPDIGELAVYRAGPDGVRTASALMSERRRTHMAWRFRISSSVTPSSAMISATMRSNRRSAESSNTVPRGAIVRMSSPSGTSMTMEESLTCTRGQSAVPVTQQTFEPMRPAIFAVCTTEDVLPV